MKYLILSVSLVFSIFTSSFTHAAQLQGQAQGQAQGQGQIAVGQGGNGFGGAGGSSGVNSSIESNTYNRAWAWSQPPYAPYEPKNGPMHHGNPFEGLDKSPGLEKYNQSIRANKDHQAFVGGRAANDPMWQERFEWKQAQREWKYQLDHFKSTGADNWPTTVTNLNPTREEIVINGEHAGYIYHFAENGHKYPRVHAK